MFVHRWNTPVHHCSRTWRPNRITVWSWNVFVKPLLKFFGTTSMLTGSLFLCSYFWIVCLVLGVFVLYWKTHSQHLHLIYFIIWSLRLARGGKWQSWREVLMCSVIWFRLVAPDNSLFWLCCLSFFPDCSFSGMVKLGVFVCSCK